MNSYPQAHVYGAVRTPFWQGLAVVLENKDAA
jgi:hypothetical protein